MRRAYTLLIYILLSASCYSYEFMDLFDPKGDVFKLSPQEFGMSDKFSGFRWTTNKENEARFYFGNGESSMKVFGVGTPEINVRFNDGRFSNALIYIYNKADCTLIHSEKQFMNLVNGIEKKIKVWSGCKGSKIARTNAGGAQEYSKKWISGPYSVILKWSSSGKGEAYSGEYINLFISRYIKGKKCTKFNPKLLLKNVVKNDQGDIYIDNIPMVDQGPKGYCAVAAAARVFRYYGYETDMHRIASLAGSSADKGTDSADMFGKLRRLSTVYHTKLIEYKKFSVRKTISEIKGYNTYAKKMHAPIYQMGCGLNPYKVYNPQILLKYKCEKQKSEYKRFLSRIKENINKGVPVIWGVMLGLYKEPVTNNQSVGGHLRLIIGYNEKKKQVIFSDTWGRGHEVKHLDSAEAWAMTTQYAVMKRK